MAPAQIKEEEHLVPEHLGCTEEKVLFAASRGR